MDYSLGMEHKVLVLLPYQMKTELLPDAEGPRVCATDYRRLQISIQLIYQRKKIHSMSLDVIPERVLVIPRHVIGNGNINAEEIT